MDQQDRERLDAFLARRRNVAKLMSAVVTHLNQGLRRGEVRRSDGLVLDMNALALAARAFLGGQLSPAFEIVARGLSPEGEMEAVQCQTLYLALDELTQAVKMARPDDVLVLNTQVRSIFTQWARIGEVLAWEPVEVGVTIGDGVAETVDLDWMVPATLLADAATRLTVLAEAFLAERSAQVPEAWFQVAEAVTSQQWVAMHNTSRALQELMLAIRVAAHVRVTEQVPV